jgi:hypothetical protein
VVAVRLVPLVFMPYPLLQFLLLEAKLAFLGHRSILLRLNVRQMVWRTRPRGWILWIPMHVDKLCDGRDPHLTEYGEIFTDGRSIDQIVEQHIALGAIGS